MIPPTNPRVALWPVTDDTEGLRSEFGACAAASCTRCNATVWNSCPPPGRSARNAASGLAAAALLETRLDTMTA